MGSRYYDPRLGRFISIDPEEPDENNLHSLNRYAYANNNPYKFTDPDGQIAETIIDVVREPASQEKVNSLRVGRTTKSCMKYQM